MAGLIGVMLTLAVWQLPQLPGQLVDEQAAATTWLLNTSTAYGIWGNPFLALGLFDVLRSPMLFLLLALLLPTLSAQLADQLGMLRQLRGVQSYALTTPSPAQGEAIHISTVRHLYRWRGIVNATPALVITSLESKIQPTFAIPKRADATILALSRLHMNHGDKVEADLGERDKNDRDEDASDLAPSPTETRLLATRASHLQYFRPLLMVGLLVSVVGAWTALAFGWQVTAPPLAPGATFRSANRDLVLHYSVATINTFHATLDVSLRGEKVSLPTDRMTQQRVGLASIQVRPTYPSVWISTADGGELLTLPGETKMRSSVGFVFADEGSEESLLIPALSSGLRIVQRGGTDGFVFELYRSDAIQPIYRAELTGGGQLTIPFGPGDPAFIVYTPFGLQVDVRHLPGLWLVPLGVFLAFLGAIAFLRPSYFVLIQVAPWASDHTVVVLQTDQPNLISDLRSALAALPPRPTVEEKNVNEDTLPPPLEPTIA